MSHTVRRSDHDGGAWVYRCRSCGRSYRFDQTIWRCPCGGLFDLAGPDVSFEPPDDSAPWSLWRYRELLPLAAGSSVWQDITLGEGTTPLVPAAGESLLLKLDFVMPTGSFKDRGAAVLVAKAAELGVRRLVADSSGNAGAAIAAYAARAGIAAEVFVPKGTSPKKVAQLRGVGATVNRSAADRQAAAEAAIEAVEGSGAFYASHVYNPVFHHGVKTVVYELWEQLGRLPGTIVLPAGNGTLLLGVAIGCQELVASGRADRLPRIVAVQAARCAPLVEAWRAAQAGGPAKAAVAHGLQEPTVAHGLHEPTVAHGLHEPTVAEGIAIARPPRLRQLLDAVRASGGTFLTAEEADILPARAALLRQGIDVEPTAAAAYAAWQAWTDAGETEGPVVLILTGSGLKAPMA